MPVTLVTVVALSTLTLSVDPAAMESVHPVSVVSELLIALDKVGLADAHIESPTVGG